MRKKDKEMSFLASILGISLSPYDTVNNLMQSEKPKQVVPILGMFYILFLAPIFILYSQSQLQMYNEEWLIVLFSIVTITLVLFILFEFLFMNLCGFHLKLSRAAAAVTYCLLPIIFFIIGMYIINAYATGSWQYMSVILTSAAKKDSLLSLFVQILSLFCSFQTFWIFFRSLKAAMHVSTSSAIILFFVSAIPFVCAVFLSSILTSLIIPDSNNIMRQFLNSPTSFSGI